MSFTTLLPVWELVIPTLLGLTIIALIEGYILKEKIKNRIIWYTVIWFLFSQASRDIGWMILVGICFYEFFQHLMKSKQNKLRLIFAIFYLIFPILVPFGCIQAAKENNGVIWFPKYAAAQIRAKISHLKSDMQHIDDALEKYKTDQHNFPLPNAGYLLSNVLTTPIAYLQVKQFPVDILTPNHPPLWYSVNSTQDMAIIASRGTDWKWQINWQNPDWFDMTTEGNLITYNPTNGTVSIGDIYHITPKTIFTFHY